jgi:hypothetical protein
MPVSSSGEALEELLRDEDLLLSTSEYGHIISANQSYKADLRTMLLRLFDCPESIDTAFKGQRTKGGDIG